MPGRINLVMTRGDTAPYAGQRVVHSLDEAIAIAGDGELAVIGGGEVFTLALPRATRMHLTWVDTAVEGADAFFPRFDAHEWKETARIAHAADARHDHAFDIRGLRKNDVGAATAAICFSCATLGQELAAVAAPTMRCASVRFLSRRRLAIRLDRDELRLLAVELQRGQPAAPDAAGVDRVDA